MSSLIASYILYEIHISKDVEIMFDCYDTYTQHIRQSLRIYRIIFRDIRTFCPVCHTCSLFHFIVERGESDSVRSLHQEFLRQQFQECVGIDIADAFTSYVACCKVTKNK